MTLGIVIIKLCMTSKLPIIKNKLICDKRISCRQILLTYNNNTMYSKIGLVIEIFIQNYQLAQLTQLAVLNQKNSGKRQISGKEHCLSYNLRSLRLAPIPRSRKTYLCKKCMQYSLCAQSICWCHSLVHCLLKSGDFVVLFMKSGG